MLEILSVVRDGDPAVRCMFPISLPSHSITYCYGILTIPLQFEKKKMDRNTEIKRNAFSVILQMFRTIGLMLSVRHA